MSISQIMFLDALKDFMNLVVLPVSVSLALPLLILWIFSKKRSEAAAKSQ